jgi:BA14K-like protein
MSNKFSTIALGAMLGFSTVAFSGASASTAAMLLLSPAVTGQANAGSDGIIQVKHKKKWKKNWDNDDYDWQYRRHRHRDRDGVYLSLPLIIGGAYAANRYYGDDYYGGDYGDDYDDDHGYDDGDYGGGLSSRHVRYCLNKYQSYNPRYNTWVAYSGQVKKCYSPYM